MQMDQMLADFIAHTGIDSALARDILAEKNWDFDGALEAYSTLVELKRSNSEKNQARGLSAVAENSKIVSSLRSQFTRGFPTTDDQQQRKTLTDDPCSSSRNNTTNAKYRKNGGGAGVTPSVYLRNGTNNCTNPYHIETPTYTFTLPNLNDFDDEFHAFLEKDLIETASLKALDASGHLNWWAAGGTCEKLWPLATTGDGNCLLHAASLGMWGFHDRLLMLRGALHLILTKGSRRHALWRRWRWQQTHQNKQAGLIYSEDEWRAEWENLVRLASPQPRSKPPSVEPLSSVDQALPNQSPPPSNEAVAAADTSEDSSDTVYESLEELHVFALAHVLKRPIIVIADTVLRDAGGEAFAPIPFGGIYLPLECPPNECHRSPLVLCYDAAHFSALVIMQDQQKANKQLPAIVPITDRDRRLLPLHFASDPGPDFTWWADDEDQKIAAAATLDDAARLDLVARYVGLCKLPSRKLRSAPLNNCFVQQQQSGTTGRFGSHDGTFARHNDSNEPRPLAAVPRHVTGSTGALETRKRLQRMHSVASAKIIWSRLTRTIRRRLKSKSRSLGGKGGGFFEKNGLIVNGDSWPRTHARCQLTGDIVNLESLVDTAVIVGAKLHIDTHQPFMQTMVENYLKSARERFELDKAKAGQPGRSAVRRERISRSFSASNVAFRCMNGECTGQASHQTNYLCETCFTKQKLLMESFTVAGTNVGTANRINNATATKASSSLNGPASSAVVLAASMTTTTGSSSDCNTSNRAVTVPISKFATTLSPAAAFSPPGVPCNVQTNKPSGAGADALSVSIARSTFYNLSTLRRSTMGRSVSPVYTIARSKFYSLNGIQQSDNDENAGGASKVTVVQPITSNGQIATTTNSNSTKSPYSTAAHHPSKGCRSVETRYGVTAVTNPHGVTHYFIPSTTTDNNSNGLSTSLDSASATSALSQECKVIDELGRSCSPFKGPPPSSFSSKNGLASRL